MDDDAAFARHRDAVYAKWSARFDDPVERCHAHLARASALVSSGQVDSAVAAARDVLAISQNDPHALNLITQRVATTGQRASSRTQ